ncbi:hypothetical protein A0256_07970 [Mucilaginibacter sp. PAMC 26640]|nr:hypothetical protein A0256_07970 [Mucilaginibacter sp. PAMC 26640]
MRIKKPELLLTLDSMKDPNTGFYYFGKALFGHINKHNQGRFKLNYYIKDKSGFFSKGLALYHLYKFHKVFFPFFYRFDIVHFSDQNCRLRPWKVLGKKVLTIHDLNQLHQPGYSDDFKKKYKLKLAKCIRYCDKVIAISNFVADDVRRNFPESADKISVIYNGADDLTVAPDFKPAYIPRKKFLFTLGPLNEKKNFHVLPSLLKDNDYEMVISGITPVLAYKELLLAEAEKYGASNRIQITGPISDDEKAWYYKNCSAFLFPSLAEGFGLPVLEAMAFGKPVFLSDKTSLPEIGGDEAFYFKSFEPADMQSVFKNGMDKFEKEQMAGKCIARAAQFSWDKTAFNYLGLYQELLSETIAKTGASA